MCQIADMKWMLKFLLTLFGLFECCQGYAEKKQQELIDSMLVALPMQKEDTNKVKLLEDLVFRYYTSDIAVGVRYGAQGLLLAEKLNWKKGIAAMNNCVGLGYHNESDVPLALAYYLKGLKIYEDIGDKEGIAKVDENIGNIYNDRSEYATALEYFYKALKIDEEIGNKKGIATATGNIGHINEEQGNHPEALACYFKALKIDEEQGYRSGIAWISCNIGNVYIARCNYPVALEYFYKALKIGEETGNISVTARASSCLANVYQSENNDRKALEYDFKSLKLYEALGSKNKIALVTGNIGVIYDDQDDNSKALEYYLKALQIYKVVGNKEGTARTTGNIGNIYMKQKNIVQAIQYEEEALRLDEKINNRQNAAVELEFIGNAYLALVTDTTTQKNMVTLSTSALEVNGLPRVAIPVGRMARLSKAIEYLQKGLSISKEMHARDVIQGCYQNLAKAYKLTGDYKRSLASYEDYLVVKDSIFSKENEEKLLKTTMEYDYDKKQIADSMQRVAFQQKKDAEATSKFKHQRTLTYIGLGGTLLLACLSFFIVKERRKSENLLLNILPSEVATELKSKGYSKAKHFDNVTVLFSDFVSFTTASERLSPQELVDELHACFKVFDEIMVRHHVEKIKTIGDAYLAVCGLPAADKNHAENAVNAANEIAVFMRDRYTKLGDKTFEVRLGIHSGNVVAGIVGTRKFAYDIWGDTVNTAARMEQNSEPGKVNISETTYQLVKEKFACEYRGEIEAKNKGHLKMYFVGAVIAA